MAGASGSTNAQKRWELENDVRALSEADSLFKYNREEQQAVQQQKPWARDPHFFKQCVLTALAGPLFWDRAWACCAWQ